MGLNQDDEKFLSNIYLNPDDKASFSRGNKLRKRVQEKKKNFDKNSIVNYLLSEPIFTLYKPRRKKFVRRKINKIFPFETIASDLADFQKLKNFNKGFSWILLNVDIYSNFIICKPLKKKSKILMTEAFTSVLHEISKNYKFQVDNVWSDRGKILILHIFTYIFEFACKCTQVYVQMHSNLHANARKFACKRTQIYMRMHANLHVNTLKFTCNYLLFFLFPQVPNLHL